MVQRVTEGSVVLDVEVGSISRKLPVFYNPVMKLNRDISVLFAKVVNIKSAADVLSGCGVRGLRLLKEAGVERVVFNDGNSLALKAIRRNAKLNKVGKVELSAQDGSLFLLNSSGFDYIDVDPFGSPNPFLDAAVKRVSRGGFIAVSATDTSALAGSHPKAGFRKYWGRPLRNHCMHEFGIRLLARKIQLLGAQYDKALIPVFCHSTLHYVRVYFKCIKGKNVVDSVLSEHKFVLSCRSCLSFSVSSQNSGVCCKKPVDVAGPLWCGSLWDSGIVKGMLSISSGESEKLLSVIAGEASVPVVGFHDIYDLCSKLHRTVPSRELIDAALKRKNIEFAWSHFSSQGLRCSLSAKELSVILKSIKN